MEKKGPRGFDTFYKSHFGDRWEGLKASLMEETKPVGFEEGLLTTYFLDEASIFCARTLEVQPDDLVLDLCAAPGGKTLVIASCLGPEGQLVSNEKSPDRKRRLQKVLSEHLGETQRKVRVTGFDATRWGLYEQGLYDRVLLDAPCSSERHVIHSKTHLDLWSPARTKHLAIQSFSLLAAGLEALKPGGVLVYSTCALSPLENDGVIEKLFKKREGQFKLETIEFSFGEKTKYGILILPDQCQGRGPLYMAKISKTQPSPE
ncbi:MAG: RNA methyltransferase [Spirochaetes bacterium GWB1_48_6]|nr:MAG: RNA methyltransferase [Spirochaetes bacterium GWB1_48_6]